MDIEKRKERALKESAEAKREQQLLFEENVIQPISPKHYRSWLENLFSSQELFEQSNIDFFSPDEDFSDVPDTYFVDDPARFAEIKRAGWFGVNSMVLIFPKGAVFFPELFGDHCSLGFHDRPSSGTFHIEQSWLKQRSQFCQNAWEVKERLERERRKREVQKARFKR